MANTAGPDLKGDGARKVRRKSVPMRRRMTTEQRVGREGVQHRGKYGRIVCAVFISLSVFTTIVGKALGTFDNPELNEAQYYVFNVLTNIFLAGNSLGICIISHKNISKTVLKRVYKDFNVILIVALSITNFVIECVRPSSQLSPVFSFNFILLVISVFSFDAVEKKTRNFTLLLNFMFLAFVVIGLYDLAIGVLDVKTVLVDFGYGRVFYKRSVKRAIYVEIFFLLADGMNVLIKDSKMELLMFASGPVYKDSENSDSPRISQSVPDSNLRKKPKLRFQVFAFMGCVAVSAIVHIVHASVGRTVPGKFIFISCYNPPSPPLTFLFSSLFRASDRCGSLLHRDYGCLWKHMLE